MKNRIVCKSTELNYQCLRNFGKRNLRNLSNSLVFIVHSYLENPDDFDFLKREWTNSTDEKKTKVISATLSDEDFSQIIEIITEKKIEMNQFIYGILDVYFLDHPEYKPVEKKSLF